MTTIAMVSTLGGVGKTSMVYHLAWMYADLGLKVLVVDFDPQANLTRLFLNASRLESLWAGSGEKGTVFSSIKPLLNGAGDVRPPNVEHITENISLLAGDLELSATEAEFALQWTKATEPDTRTIIVISALSQTVQAAVRQSGAGVVLMDLAPNFSALNRTALAAARYIVTPVSTSGTYSVGLRILGTVLRRWRDEWKITRSVNPLPELALPSNAMCPSGYIIRKDHSWLGRTAESEGLLRHTASAYHELVLGEPTEPFPSPESDPYFLGSLQQYQSLISIAHEARKPIFSLMPADGAIGAHARAVQDAYREYFALARNIAVRCDLDL